VPSILFLQFTRCVRWRSLIWASWEPTYNLRIHVFLDEPDIRERVLTLMLQENRGVEIHRAIGLNIGRRALRCRGGLCAILEFLNQHVKPNSKHLCTRTSRLLLRELEQHELVCFSQFAY